MMSTDGLQLFEAIMTDSVMYSYEMWLHAENGLQVLHQSDM